MKILLLLAFTAQSGFCGEYNFTKSVDVGSLEKNLNAAGFVVDGISCVGNKCVLSLPAAEKKDPSEVIAAEPVQKSKTTIDSERNALKAEGEELESRLDTLTNAELRRLIKIMLKRMRISRDG